MYCSKCGNEIADNAKFCPKCGTRIENVPEKKKFVLGLKNKAADGTSLPGMQLKLRPVIITLAAVLAVAVAGIGIYDAVRTKKFKDVIAEFETMPDNYASIGKYKSDYDELLADSQKAAAAFRFWEYAGFTSEMESMAAEIGEMNEAVAEYRDKYDSIVKEIEIEGKYIMDDYEADYQNVKKTFEASLQEFDESACRTNAQSFEGVRNRIVTGNQEKAEEYIAGTEQIKSMFIGSANITPFEEYRIQDFVSHIENDKNALDYSGLYADYTALSDWVEKISVAASSSEQISKYVQADVSGQDTVKLYINSYAYQQYDFMLEDFVVYEKYNELWNECHAEEIAQIEGMLTMDIVADISSSMNYCFYDMQLSIDRFIAETNSDTMLGLSTIGSIYERHQGFTSDKNRVADAVWNLECYGLTSLYQSLYSSVVYTASAEGARCVVAFTDGYNEPYGVGYDYNAQDVIDVSLYYQVPVYIIGIGNYVQSAELRNIAETTGGAYYANRSVYDLADIYRDIYEAQGRMYQLTYKTQVPNNINRDIYVLYADSTQNLGIRFESELNAEALQTAYAAASLNADDLSTYYTESKYLSSDDLAKLGDSLEAVQTVINIYFSKNGYAFGDTENGRKQLNNMINMGVITENGMLDGDTVTEILRADPILWHNFSALYNRRYELVYTVALDLYRNNPYITYEELRSQINQHYGEENETRFELVISTAWNNIQAGQ